MGKCKDCKWWKALQLTYDETLPKEVGKCKKLSKLAFKLAESNGVYTDYADRELFTGMNFGCIHFGRRGK